MVIAFSGESALLNARLNFPVPWHCGSAFIRNQVAALCHASGPDVPEAQLDLLPSVECDDGDGDGDGDGYRYPLTRRVLMIPPLCVNSRWAEPVLVNAADKMMSLIDSRHNMQSPRPYRGYQAHSGSPG